MTSTATVLFLLSLLQSSSLSTNSKTCNNSPLPIRFLSSRINARVRDMTQETCRNDPRTPEQLPGLWKGVLLQWSVRICFMNMSIIVIFLHALFSVDKGYRISGYAIISNLACLHHIYSQTFLLQISLKANRILHPNMTSDIRIKSSTSQSCLGFSQANRFHSTQYAVQSYA